jgi:hypothetical protein
MEAAPSSNCGLIHVRPRNLMEKFTTGNWIVVDRSAVDYKQNQRIQRRRQRRNTVEKIIQNGPCSWKFSLDDNPSRIPRFLPKAELMCNNCSHYCKETNWEHHVLIKDCHRLKSQRQKVDIWKTSTESLPISFAFNPWTKETSTVLFKKESLS